MTDDRRWSKVDELFDAVLDQPPEQRARWLDDACQGDGELRAAVGRLLVLSERDDDALRPMGALDGPLWAEVARDLQTEPAAGEELPPGHALEGYVIQGLLGRGGTGTVYRATDPRLNREVAVKALSRGFAEGSPELRRLEREARLLASLNHPNIAVVHELLFVEHTPYLVLELVPGESLAERLSRGPVSLAEAVRVAEQVAEALEEAYRNGVVHRDLKPGNVMLTPAGRVKVLDFGLAKAQPGGASDITPSLPVGTPPTTREGVVMGTPAYMSPEQARGEVVDHRTDVWALGCILYEMVTGHRAFRGETVTETLAAVLRDEVDWGRLPSATPSALRRLLRRCLQKDPRLRLQDVGDARIELADMPEAAVDRWPWAGLDSWRRPALVVAGALAAAIAAFLALRAPLPLSTSAATPLVRVSVPTGPDVRPWIGGSHALAVAPDGSRFAFVGESGGRAQLYVRELGSYTPTPVRNSDDARTPFYSPDGEWIGFFAQGELRKVTSAGGTPARIAASGLQPRGASWSEDGRIVFAQVGAPGLQLVDASGGAVRTLSTVDRARGEVGHFWPHWLPGGKSLLFTVQHTGSTAAEEIHVLTPGSGEPRRLREGAQAAYARSGHLVFVSGDRLEAAPFDLSRLEATGPSAPVLESLAIYPRGAAAYALSADGALLYVPSVDATALGWVDVDGRTEAVETPPGTPGWPRLSPDGRRVAVHVGRPGSREVWLLEVDRPRAWRQLTFEGGGFPVWSPDSRRLAFTSQREGGASLTVIAADGSDEPRRLFEGTQSRIPVSWSKDGLLAYYEIGQGNQRDIWVVDAAGGAPPVAFVATPANELSPVFSPDGRWVAYVSNETGRNEVYVRPYPPPGPVTAVSIDGGTEPVWRRDGAELYYRHEDFLMAVAVRRTPGFSAGQPRRVLRMEMVPNAAGNPGYDVLPDGRRFLALRPTAEASMDGLHLVLGWRTELERLAPAAR
jgi:serine/threonine-protein kinase